MPGVLNVKENDWPGVMLPLFQTPVLLADVWVVPPVVFVQRTVEPWLMVTVHWERFPFGGFADDSEDRPALILAGARRGAERLGAPLDRCRVVVIGDTPKDVAAAKANGFDSLAVATGQHPLAELTTVGATLAVSELTDPRVEASLFPG